MGIVAVVIAQRVLRQEQSETQKMRFDGAGFLTAASGSALLLYGIAAVTSGNVTISTILLLCGGIVLLFAFVAIELFKVRHGRAPLLDVRRFQDRTFRFSAIAQVLNVFVRFGILFLIPIYLQTLLQKTPLQAGAIQAAQAMATMAVLPIGGRLADRIGPRSVVMVGLLIFVAAAVLMTLTLTTPIWKIVGILVLMAIPGTTMDAIISQHADQLDGKIIIDATNKRGASVYNSFASLQQYTPHAHMYRAFNTYVWENFAQPDYEGVPADLFFCGIEGDSRVVVEQLISDIGLRPIYLGGVEKVSLVDSVFELWIALAMGQGNGRRLVFKVLTQ